VAKRHLQLALMMIAGIFVGAFFASRPLAQGSPPAYAVIDVTEITDLEAFNKVLAGTPLGLVPFGGRYVVRTDNPTPLEGIPPKRFVVIAFDTVERAQRWSMSAPVKEVNAVRSQSAKWRSFIVEGLPH
jgi:uncharacterized protein (DUF1330 family)